jgi:hypothetical protein
MCDKPIAQNLTISLNFDHQSSLIFSSFKSCKNKCPIGFPFPFKVKVGLEGVSDYGCVT